ncbi:MAG: class D sortase [Clostridium sp.]|nr:class D sortase [Clostridium sp.]
MVVAICNFSHKNILLISFIISILIFIFFDQIFFKNQNKFFENSLEKIIPDNIEIELKTPNNTVAISEQYQNKIDTKKIWQIEIPRINLVAPIAEGTSANIMNEYVGHFEETPKNKGNIGLAAHNRGYKVNYFQNLKLLQKGDLIIYTYNGEISKYSVNELGIIKDIDWSKLESSSQDKLTLITCLEDEPEYRRYIQAVKV